MSKEMTIRSKNIRDVIEVLMTDCEYLILKNESIGVDARVDLALSDIQAIRHREVPKKEELARLMHETYELQAKIVGWKTQECCQTPWETLPTANQQVMLAVAQEVIDQIHARIDEEK